MNNLGSTCIDNATKFQGHQSIGSGEKDFFKVFTIYGHGGHVGHVIQIIYINFFIAGRPKAALLFWFFCDFRCGALLFVVIHVIYKYKNR